MERARIVLLGVGGLGCPAALALAQESRERALPLELLLVDDDRVDRSNLPRQTLFTERDAGRQKVEAAAEALHKLVPDAPIQFVPRAIRFEESTARELLAGAALLLDGTDSFETRFLANDLALAARIPLIHGAALGWTGQLLTVLPGGPCLRCLFEAPPSPGTVPACAEAGVAAPLCGLIGAAMASEAARILAGEPPRARGKLLRWEGLSGRQRSISIPRDPACAGCGEPKIARLRKLTLATPFDLRHQSLAFPSWSLQMPITVKIPAPLRPLTQNQSEVVLESASTVGAAVEELSARFPGLRERLLDDKGGLRRYINLFRNDTDVRSAGGLAATLSEGDRLSVVPAIAGGR